MHNFEQISPGERLLYLRQSCGMSRTFFEKKYKISANTLKSYEANQRRISYNQAVLFTEIFNALGAGITDEFILSGVTYINSDDPSTVLSSFTEEFQIEREVNILKQSSPYLTFIKMCDDTMFPTYNCGDVLAGKTINNASLFERFIGKCCIIESESGEKVLRKILNTDQFFIHCAILNRMTKEKVEETQIIESKYIAHATRHWQVSELVYC